jgi:hypothetical protein
LPPLFEPEAKYRFKVYVLRTLRFLGFDRLISRGESIKYIVRRRLEK